MDWRVNGVSIELEELMAIISHDLPRPLAVLVFGADSGRKAKAYKRLRGKLGEPLAFDRQLTDSNYLYRAKNTIRRGRPVIICMHGNDSYRPVLRMQVAQQLKSFGAESVIGVYVKVCESDKVNFIALDSEPGFDYPCYYKQIKKLDEDPPHAREFDFFVVVGND